MQADSPITIADLYPELPVENQKAAEENLERYLELVISVYERIVRDPEELRRFRELQTTPQPDDLPSLALTDGFPSPTMNTDQVESTP